MNPVKLNNKILISRYKTSIIDHAIMVVHEASDADRLKQAKQVVDFEEELLRRLEAKT